MLADAISSSLPMAVGVALSPIPVAAILVILMSARAATNAPAFLLGWMAGILTIGLIVSLMPGLLTARGEPTQLSGLTRVALGAALLLLAGHQWRQRPAPEAVGNVPPLLARLDANLQLVAPRRQRTGGVGSECAGHVVGEVEIDHGRACFVCRRRVEKTTGAVGRDPAGCVTKDQVVALVLGGADSRGGRAVPAEAPPPRRRPRGRCRCRELGQRRGALT